MTTLTIQEDKDTGEFYLEFPDDVLEQVGWKEGDTIKWTDNEDGSWTLTKVVAETTEERLAALEKLVQDLAHNIFKLTDLVKIQQNYPFRTPGKGEFLD